MLGITKKSYALYSGSQKVCDKLNSGLKFEIDLAEIFPYLREDMDIKPKTVLFQVVKECINDNRGHIIDRWSEIIGRKRTEL